MREVNTSIKWGQGKEGQKFLSIAPEITRAKTKAIFQVENQAKLFATESGPSLVAELHHRAGGVEADELGAEVGVLDEVVREGAE